MTKGIEMEWIKDSVNNLILKNGQRNREIVSANFVERDFA